MTETIKVPTKAEYETLFDAMLKWRRIHGSVNYGDLWFDLYRRAWLTGRRWPRLSAIQERYLAAMGFDEREPILDPEAAKYHGMLVKGIFEDPDSYRPRKPLKSTDHLNDNAWAALERARRHILIERMIRGVALREGGQEGTSYWFTNADGRTAFYEVSLKRKQHSHTEHLEMLVPKAAYPWDRLVINRKARKIVAVVNDMKSFTNVWGGDAHALRNLVEDPSSPEFGYAFQVIRIVGPIVEYDYMNRIYGDVKHYAGVPQMRTILVGAGQAANREFHAAWADRDRMADYILTKGVEWLNARAKERDPLKYEDQVHEWLVRIFAPAWKKQRTSRAWRKRVDGAVAKVVKDSEWLSGQVKELAAREDISPWGLDPVAPNDPSLLKEPEELEHYALHKRDRLAKIAGVGAPKTTVRRGL